MDPEEAPLFNRRVHTLALALSTLLLPLLPGDARASMALALDLSALVEQADVIVVARVVAQQAHYDESGRIVTDVELVVESAEKGELAPNDTVLVRRLGGVVGRLGMRVEGEPSFEEGELTLLFGKRGQPSEPLRPLGMAQGVLRVRETLGERWVHDGSAGLALLQRDVAGHLQKARPMLSEPRRLEDLLSAIRQELKRAR